MGRRARCTLGCGRLIDKRGTYRHEAWHRGEAHSTKPEIKAKVTTTPKFKPTAKYKTKTPKVDTFFNDDRMIIDICQAFFPQNPLLWTILNRLLQAGMTTDLKEQSTILRFCRQYIDAYLGDVTVEIGEVHAKGNGTYREVESSTIPISPIDLVNEHSV